MAAIITDQIRILNAGNFVAGVSNASNSYYSFIGLTNHLVHSYRFSTRVLTYLAALFGGAILVDHPQAFPKRPIFLKMVGTHNQTRCLQPLGRNPPSLCITPA